MTRGWGERGRVKVGRRLVGGLGRYGEHWTDPKGRFAAASDREVRPGELGPSSHIYSLRRPNVSPESPVLRHGRTKIESVERLEGVTGPASHVQRTTVQENGEEVKIFRRTACGSVEDRGTVFVGYSKQQDLLHSMLEGMAGIPYGIRDALTYYTDALSGSSYHIPCIEALQSCGGAG